MVTVIYLGVVVPLLLAGLSYANWSLWQIILAELNERSH